MWILEDSKVLIQFRRAKPEAQDEFVGFLKAESLVEVSSGRREAEIDAIDSFRVRLPHVRSMVRHSRIYPRLALVVSES